MSDTDLIIGLHSIAAAIENPQRELVELVCTDDGLSELKKRCDLRKISPRLVGPHKLQEEGKKHFRDLKSDFNRIPSGAFLIAQKLPEKDAKFLYDIAAQGEQRILCLDQVTDVHNGAAILRTAAFYGVNTVVLPGKNSFGETPTYFRIASGAHEYLNLVKVNNLAKTVTKLKEIGVMTIGLSEHAEETLETQTIRANPGGVALVLGKEETGISHAVMRVIEHKMSIASQGQIKSLNVSVAAAVSMEKCFGIS